MENLDSDSDHEDNSTIVKKKETKFDILKTDLRIELMMEEFWLLLKEWASKYTSISTFKNWENKLKIRLHNFPVGQHLILQIDSDEMVDSSSTVLDYLKLLFKYLKPFPELKTKINKKILSWRANKGGMMRNILDLPMQKCDHYRVKKIIENKLAQDDELGIDLSHMAPENRRICIAALSQAKKRPIHRPHANPNQNNPNPNNNTVVILSNFFILKVF